MRPLRVALVNRVGSVPGKRQVGWWSYETPEFEVTHFPIDKGATLDRHDFADYDLIVWEDGKSVLNWTGDGPPLAYHVVDSTLSASAYEHRLEMGKQADLILVDWDRLERFASLKKPVARFNYCVNDRVFKDHDEPRTTDIAFHMDCKRDNARTEVREWARRFCWRYGYSLSAGVIGGDAYAHCFNQAKVALNLERTPNTRAHRVFDAMACRTSVVTTPEPEVSGEERRAGEHYVEWRDYDDLARKLTVLLKSGAWEPIADAGYELVHRAHTWAVRAAQLRQTLAETLGL
jgi:glycosyltransferase involved in cell wall biosynthesis